MHLTPLSTTQCKRNDRAKAQRLKKALICRRQRVSIFAYTLALSAIQVRCVLSENTRLR